MADVLDFMNDVLVGTMSDETYELRVDQLLEAFPRLRPMRDVAASVLAARREVTSSRTNTVDDIKRRLDADRAAVWATFRAEWRGRPQWDEEKFDSDLETAVNQTQALLDDAIEKMDKAIDDDFEHRARCHQLLIWTYERETLQAGTKCS